MNPFHYAYDKLFPVIRFVYERIQRHRWFDKIGDHLWLGGAPLYPRDYEFLLDAGIDAVVNIRAERHDDVALYERHGIEYLRLPVLDILVPPPDIISEGVSFMRQNIMAGKTVLVHCAKGRGRSVTLVAAYLMCYEGMSFDEVDHFLRDIRPLSNLQERHRAVLEPWLEACTTEPASVSDRALTTS